MALWEKLKFWGKTEAPITHRHGTIGEKAAKKFLKVKGCKFLTANYRAARGEIDLVFRDRDCLVFVEVKTRSSEAWTRPSSAVDARKRMALRRAAWEYLRLLENPQVKYRFDIVEVLLNDGHVAEVRHIENASMRPRRRF